MVSRWLPPAKKPHCSCPSITLFGYTPVLDGDCDPSFVAPYRLTAVSALMPTVVILSFTFFIFAIENCVPDWASSEISFHFGVAALNHVKFAWMVSFGSVSNTSMEN